jgi:hypothetical protein
MDYPVLISLNRESRSSRLHLFFAFFIALPVMIVLFFKGILGLIYHALAWWIVLFTGRYPQSFWEYNKNMAVANAQLSAYFSHLTDVKPSSDFNSLSSHPVKIELAYPERISRLVLLFGFFMVIPHFIMFFFRAIGLYFVVLIAFLAILFTGTYPEGLWNYSYRFFRFTTRLNFFLNFLTDKRPPNNGN